MQRAGNPCKEISLPTNLATEEKATFLTAEEGRRGRAEPAEPYASFFTFLVHAGVRYPEATAPNAQDFDPAPGGQHVVLQRDCGEERPRAKSSCHA